MKDFLILFLQLSLALTVAQLGSEFIKKAAVLLWSGVIEWAWRVIR